MTNPVQDREAPEKVPFGYKICWEIFHSLKLNIIWIIHHEFMSTTIMAIQRSCYHILVFNCYTLNNWQNTFCKSPQYMIYFYIIGAHHLKVPLGWSKIAPFFSLFIFWFWDVVHYYSRNKLPWPFLFFASPRWRKITSAGCWFQQIAW